MSAKFNMGMNMNMSIDLEKGNYNTFPPKHPGMSKSQLHLYHEKA